MQRSWILKRIEARSFFVSTSVTLSVTARFSIAVFSLSCSFPSSLFARTTVKLKFCFIEVVPISVYTAQSSVS